MDIPSLLKQITLVADSTTYGITKMASPIDNPKAQILYKGEYTIIDRYDRLQKIEAKPISGPWILFSFDTILEFSLTGFIAYVSKLLADEEISVFVLSSFDTDHFLVKEADAQKTIELFTPICNQVIASGI